MKFAGAVARRHTCPDGIVWIHPLAGGRARQQLQEHLEILKPRNHFLDADQADHHLGNVTHMRPLPSDSTTQIEPVSATAKFAPLIPTFTRRNFSRR